MAQVTQTGTRFYVGITEVESSVKCVQKREYSRNIDTIQLYISQWVLLIQKKTRRKSHPQSHAHEQNCGFYWPRANDTKMW